MRAFLWFGLFALLAVAPLAVAGLFVDEVDARSFTVELGAAFGLVAFALIASLFALVSRLHAVSKPFGNDALMLFHRHMGLIACVFALSHAVALFGHGANWASLNPFAGSLGARTGAIAIWALGVLVVSSVFRRRLEAGTTAQGKQNRAGGLSTPTGRSFGLTYEWWQRIHRWLALAVVGSMLAHALAAGAYTSSPFVRSVLIGYAILFVALMAHYRVLRPLRAWRRPWEVRANRDEGGDTRTLVLRPVGHAGFEFEPGQFVWITADRTPFGASEHPISISSSSERNVAGELDLSIKALGDWSREVIPALPIGARVWLDGPFGTFSIDRAAAQRFVLIAGGVGVTPMRSMLLSMRDRGDRRPVTLFYAARNRSRAAFANELEVLAAEMPFELVLVFEEPGDERAEHGLVSTELLRRRLPNDLRRTEFFVCGPGPMMDALERSLSELGLERRRVRTERFDMV